jgi:hypothetical protein
VTVPAAEFEFVRAFVLPSLRERWLYMLQSPKKRQKHLQRLHHGFDFEADHVERLRHHSSHQGAFVAMLKAHGAGNLVQVISTRPFLDGKVFSFEEATSLQDGVAWEPSTICIYVSNRLAVFADEYDRYVLRKV